MMLIISLMIAAYFFVIAFISTNEIMIGLGAFAVVLIDLSLWMMPKLKRSLSNRKRAKEAFFFIHQMIIGISVHQNVQKAFLAIIEQRKADFMPMLEQVEPMDGVETLQYLSQFFPLKIYDMFLHLISIYIEQGTDILKSSELLREQLAVQETQLDKQKSIQEKTLIENVVLWIFSTLIVVACRYGIADFYLRMIENPMIVMGFGLYLLFVLYAVHRLVDMYVSVEIVGWKDDIHRSR